MFSWSVFWVVSIFIGTVGVSLGTQIGNQIFQIILLILSLILIFFGLKITIIPLTILMFFAILAITSIRKKISMWWTLAPILAVWVIAKCLGFVLIPSLPLIAFVGISYFVVKLFTFLRDYQSGLIKTPNSLTILNYLFFAPTFLAGPMHYFREFDKSVKEPKLPNLVAIIPLIYRILWGAIKTLVLSPLLIPHGLPVPADLHLTFTDLLLRSFVFTLQLYFEFSGYSDMAIGSAKLMGINTPENFNQPLLSRNIVEFWQRWHITLMRAITAYIYVPLARRLSLKKAINPRLIMAITTIIAFFISGFWHGASVNFILWGLYNALIIIIYELCRPSFVKFNKNPILSGKLMQRIMHISSIAITFFFISVGWIFFNLNSILISKIIEFSS
jgi:D-alanyl-lipoteichoic acid acyltransferase DltB (MBOAT superfamily)